MLTEKELYIKFLLKEQLSPAEFALLRDDEDFWAIAMQVFANMTETDDIYTSSHNLTKKKKDAILEAKRHCIQPKFTYEEWYLLISLGVSGYCNPKEDYFEIKGLCSPHERYGADMENILQHFANDWAKNEVFKQDETSGEFYLSGTGLKVYREEIIPILERLKKKLPLFDKESIDQQVLAMMKPAPKQEEQKDSSKEDITYYHIYRR